MMLAVNSHLHRTDSELGSKFTESKLQLTGSEGLKKQRRQLFVILC